MTQSIAIEFRAIEDLVPSPRNARVHDDEQVDQVARSIQEFGFTNPILVDEDGTIVAGHGRSGPIKWWGKEPEGPRSRPRPIKTCSGCR